MIRRRRPFLQRLAMRCGTARFLSTVVGGGVLCLAFAPGAALAVYVVDGGSGAGVRAQRGNVAAPASAQAQDSWIDLSSSGGERYFHRALQAYGLTPGATPRALESDRHRSGASAGVLDATTEQGWSLGAPLAPELQSWAVLLAGFVALGGLVARRTRDLSH